MNNNEIKKNGCFTFNVNQGAIESCGVNSCDYLYVVDVDKTLTYLDEETVYNSTIKNKGVYKWSTAWDEWHIINNFDYMDELMKYINTYIDETVECVNDTVECVNDNTAKDNTYKIRFAGIDKTFITNNEIKNAIRILTDYKVIDKNWSIIDDTKEVALF